MTGGGSIPTVIAAMLISQLTGVNLTSMLGTQQQTGTTTSAASSVGTSVYAGGNNVNKYTQCRMVVTVESLDAMQTKQLPAQAGLKYAEPKFVLWDSTQTSSICDSASSVVGPFYYSGDRTVYLDMSFLPEMECSLGAADTPLVEEYITARGFGHHIQHLTEQMVKTNRSGSGATSDSVQLELQVDCYAGIWTNHASSTLDPDTDKPFPNRPNNEGIKGAPGVAEVAGDDHIQERVKEHVDSDTRTRGFSEQRVHWFTTGINSGSVQACNTLAVNASQL